MNSRLNRFCATAALLQFLLLTGSVAPAHEADTSPGGAASELPSDETRPQAGEGAGPGNPEGRGHKPPNIVVVFIDDMGWGDFSCFGNQDAETPNIDRLAAEGIRFTSFYVNSPICSPSRCALTTGQYPQRYRITSYLNNRADNERRGMAQWLDPDAPSLARYLQKAGYATGHFGKWHLGGQRDVTDAPPISAYGFDETLTNFEGMGPKLLPLTLRPGDREPGRIWDRAEVLGGPVVWMQRSEITGGFVRSALAFVRRARAAEQPFFINIWPDDVHSPYWPPVESWGDGARRTLYLAVLEAADRQLGRLFDHVRSDEQLKNNTVVIVCSDNGPEPGAGQAGPFRGYKTHLFEGGIRSPLIVWAPGLISSDRNGHEDGESVLAAFDLTPSLLTIAGVPHPADADFDGEDISETLLGRAGHVRDRPLFFRRPPDRDSFYDIDNLPDLAMRSGRWKLLCEFDGSAAELYDVTADPGESDNAAGRHPEVVRRLTEDLLNWNSRMPADNGPQLTGARSRNNRRRQRQNQ